MSILHDHLNRLLKRNIIVVMADDMAYFGQLREFDENFLILDHVKEAEYRKNPIWKEPRIKVSASPLPLGREHRKDKILCIGDERMVGKSLGTVVVNISHVLRIWGEDLLDGSDC